MDGAGRGGVGALPPSPPSRRLPRDICGQKKPGADAALDSGAAALYLRDMRRVFDMDDRARLPWRFFGAQHSVLARL